jgi:hypothetical protein
MKKTFCRSVVATNIRSGVQLVNYLQDLWCLRPDLDLDDLEEEARYVS